MIKSIDPFPISLKFVIMHIIQNFIHKNDLMN
jgi:hypothetical protein